MSEIECYPRILAVGEECEVSVVLPAEAAVSGKPRARLLAYEGIGDGANCDLPDTAINCTDSCVRVRVCLPGEQEYLLRIFPGDAGDSKPLAECRIYGVESDLVSLRPLKGDFHQHSNRSDGKEPPAELAVASRGTGLDFMAVTDHGLYEPSLEAARPFEGLSMDFRIYPGEEVHPPDNPVHMINFGGRASVNDLFSDPSYASEVAAIAGDMKAFTKDTHKEQYASCLWCYRKIRELGGLGVFCHPYWITRKQFNVCEPVIAKHFEERPFGAYEVFGGYGLHEYEANTLQVARYYEERMRNPDLPIVGASDSHGSDPEYLFGWYYTILFAVSPDLADLAVAIRDLRAVAVAALPGRPPEVVGPFRMVKLALFLMREYMPGHDLLCRKQADALEECLGDKQGSEERVSAIQSELDDYHRRLWCRESNLGRVEG